MFPMEEEMEILESIGCIRDKKLCFGGRQLSLIFIRRLELAG